MNNHNCNTCTNTDTCKKGTSKNTEKKPEGANNQAYGFYSRVLNKPFDSVAELREAENAYYAEIRAKEEKSNAKTVDAKKVEEAFKALNAARKAYKEDLEQLTDEYSEALAELKQAFETGRADMQAKLAAAEDNYAKALKEFTEKYPEYILTFKDGNTVATLSSQTKTQNNKRVDASLQNLFDLLFNF
jgi:predicted  nucleic acid-binding Zn-ribbon protein